MGGWRRWALVSRDGVAPSQKVDVSASVNLPLHHKVQKFSSGTGSPRWSRKKGRKTGVCVCVCVWYCDTGARTSLGTNNLVISNSNPMTFRVRRYVVIAMEPVHQLQICPMLHNYKHPLPLPQVTSRSMQLCGNVAWDRPTYPTTPQVHRYTTS